MDVNEEEWRIVGRFAVDEFNKISGRQLIYKHVVNGRVINAGRNIIFIFVIEVLNEDVISWSYIAKVESCGFNLKMLDLLSFEDVLKDYNKP